MDFAALKQRVHFREVGRKLGLLFEMEVMDLRLAFAVKGSAIVGEPFLDWRGFRLDRFAVLYQSGRGFRDQRFLLIGSFALCLSVLSALEQRIGIGFCEKGFLLVRRSAFCQRLFGGGESLGVHGILLM